MKNHQYWLILLTPRPSMWAKKPPINIIRILSQNPPILVYYNSGLDPPRDRQWRKAGRRPWRPPEGRAVARGRSSWPPGMDEETIKTKNPKCRLYWCLIEFIDWRYSESCWYFRPFLETVAPLSSLWSPPPLPKVNVYYTDSVCCGGGGGCLVVL